MWLKYLLVQTTPFRIELQTLSTNILWRNSKRANYIHLTLSPTHRRRRRNTHPTRGVESPSRTEGKSVSPFREREREKFSIFLLLFFFIRLVLFIILFYKVIVVIRCLYFFCYVRIVSGEWNFHSEYFPYCKIFL